MIALNQFFSLSEIDFDTLFDASFPNMETGMYVWPDAQMSYEDKKQFMQNLCQEILDVDTSFCFTVAEDDRVLMALFGNIYNGKYFNAIGLMQDDVNGSRAYIRTLKIDELFAPFLAPHGVNEFISTLEENAPSIKMNEETYGYCDDRIEIVEVDGGRRLVLFSLYKLEDNNG